MDNGELVTKKTTVISLLTAKNFFFLNKRKIIIPVKENEIKKALITTPKFLSYSNFLAKKIKLQIVSMLIPIDKL